MYLLVIYQYFAKLHMCLCVCVCVCVCVCLCVYFLPPLRLLMTEQKNKCNARVPVSNSMLWKYLCMKYLCLRVNDNHRRNLEARKCAKKVTRSKRKLLSTF